MSPRVCTNAVPAAAILAAFWASPGLARPKSPIAATLKVCPGFAAVRSIPLLVAVPLVTEYMYRVAEPRPESATTWCWTTPAGSVTRCVETDVVP